MSASEDLARTVAHARATLAALRLRGGSVTVGDTTYPNSFAEGKAYRLIICPLCEDTGRLTDDEGTFGGFCDCRTGDAQHDHDNPGWWAS